MKTLKLLSTVLFLIAFNAGLNGQTLVGYYPFDGSPFQCVDYAGTNNGAMAGVQIAPDSLGNPIGAYHFDGDDFIAFANSPITADDSFSISAWIKLDSINIANPIVSLGYTGINTGNELSFGVYDNNRLVVENIGATGINSNLGSLIANKWYHIAVVHSGNSWAASEYDFYINGIQHVINTLNGNQNGPFPLNNGMAIGTGLGGATFPGYFFHGSIDDVRIYDGALQPIDVFTLYFNGVPTGVESHDGTGNIKVHITSDNVLYVYNPADNLNGNIVSVYDITGRKVLQSNLTEQTQEFNLSGFNSGLYMVEVSGKGFQTVEKVYVR